MDLAHILEKIFLKVDYKSLKTCHEVSHEWKEFLMSKSFLERAKSEFCTEIEDEGKRLFMMSERGNAHAVRKLLSFGLVDVNYVRWLHDELDGTPFDDATPLQRSAANGHQGVVQILLEKGADPNKADEKGRTPLHWAAIRGRRGLAKILLDGGADPRSTTVGGPGFGGLTPLHWAACQPRPTPGHNEVVKILIDGGADPDELGGCGKSPLAYAVEHDHQAVVKTLLDRGASPNKNINELHGETDLFTAILCGEDEVVVRLLLDAGADPNVTNDKRQTALDYANEVCRGQWLERTVKIIKDAGGREGSRRNDQEISM